MLKAHERAHLRKQEEKQLRYNVLFKAFALRFFIGIGPIKRLRGKATRPLIVDFIYAYAAAQSLVLSHVGAMRVAFDGDMKSMSERVLAEQRRIEKENLTNKKNRLTVDQMFASSELEDWKQ